MLRKRLSHHKTKFHKQAGEGALGDKSDAAPHRIVHARCGKTGSSRLISVSSAAVAAAAELRSMGVKGPFTAQKKHALTRVMGRLGINSDAQVSLNAALRCTPVATCTSQSGSQVSRNLMCTKRTFRSGTQNIAINNVLNALIM